MRLVRTRRPALALGGGLLLLVAAAITLLGGGGGSAAAGVPVVVLAEPASAGEQLDPARLRVERWPAERVPPNAVARVEDVAFRAAAVSLPPGLPLIPSFVRAPGQGLALRPGERAVGVRVDEVGGLPGLLRVGDRVDVLVAGAGRDAEPELVAEGVEVVARPRVAPDGASWAVALRVPAAVAIEPASADAASRRVALLGREAASP
jgi:pilus assembly protein CpaB